jgi:CelD/BcsL family acetyltransferase involved in cellulose biosynthesis
VALEIHGEIEQLADEWDELADRAGAPVFLRPGWVLAWRSAFGRGSLEVLATRRAGRLTGVLPMQRRRGGLFSPANWHTPGFGPLADDADALEELLGVLYERGRGRRVSLEFVEAGAPGTGRLGEAAAAAGWRLRLYTLERSPYLELRGSWDDHQRRLSSKRRSNMRRMRRRLEELGSVTLQVQDGRDGLEALLEEGFAVEASGWKGESGTAIASTPETRRFYTETARWAAPRGWLRLAFLRLDGRPLAFDYALEEGGFHYLLKTGFDPEYRSYAPGILIRREMIARAVEAGLRSYEFLGTEANWKLEWTDTERHLRAIEAFSPTVVGTASWILWAYARPALNRALRRQ